MTDHHLTVDKQGRLLYRGEEMLYVYEAGDCDYLKWQPEEKWIPRLISYLYDQGNTGPMEPGRVYLPDGRLLGEIVPCGFNHEEPFDG